MRTNLRSLATHLAAGLLLACSNSGSGMAAPDAHTLVAVDPIDLPDPDAEGASIDNGVCRGPNSTGAYVAELIDVSRDVDMDSLLTESEAADFPVQASPATACTRSVAFARVVENREYIAKVWTYADADGDPDTVDVCTIDGTSVAVTRVDGRCTTMLATPVAQFTCYGWRRPAPQSAEHADATSQSPSASCDAAGSLGCPGIALGYRLMTLHYCVLDSDP
jgi:hypothetical protein